MTVPVKRLPIELEPDSSRVITRFFGPGEETRIRDIIGRALAIPEATVATLLAKLERDFRPREHVCFHPTAVRAGKASEVHEHELLLLRTMPQCGIEVVGKPFQFVTVNA